jgi:hypothetical protein
MNHLYIILNIVPEAIDSIGFLWCKHSSITWNIICEREDDLEIDYEYVCMNSNIKFEHIHNKSYDENVYITLSANPNITWDIVRDNLDLAWDGFSLSANPNITWDIVQANPSIKWNYSKLSSNPNITWDIVQANPDKEWNYYNLSYNPNITWDIIRDNPDKDWNYEYTSYNPNINMDIVKSNPDKKWHYPSITTHDILENKEFRQFPIPVCNSPSITPDILTKHVKPEFEPQDLSSNNNITWKYVYYNSGDWKYTEVAHSFDSGRWNSAAKIQHVFRRWSRKMKMEISTQLLAKPEILGEILPTELCVYISCFSIE